VPRRLYVQHLESVTPPDAKFIGSVRGVMRDMPIEQVQNKFRASKFSENKNKFKKSQVQMLIVMRDKGHLGSSSGGWRDA
jgi:hypothetical protein